jgi:hypothetical protein
MVLSLLSLLDHERVYIGIAAPRSGRVTQRTRRVLVARWRPVNSAHLVARVRVGAKFENGVLVERPDESASGDTHAA